MIQIKIKYAKWINEKFNLPQYLQYLNMALIKLHYYKTILLGVVVAY